MMSADDDVNARVEHESKVKRPVAERLAETNRRLPGFASKAALIHSDLLALSSHPTLTKEDVLFFFYKHGLWIGPNTDLGLLEWLRRDAVNSPDQGFETMLERLLDKEEEMYALFTLADESQNGQIDAEELRRLCFLCGEPISLQEAVGMLKVVDRDASGTISYHEWFNAMGAYHMSLPGMTALARNVKESAKMFLKELQKKSESRMVDNGLDNFHLDDLSRKTSSVPRSKFLIAAFVAAVVTRTLTAPLDRIGCLLQVPIHFRLSLKSKAVAPPKLEFQSARQTLRDIVQREGFPALWKGNGINILRVVPEIATRAYIFEAFKELGVWLDPSVETKSELPVEHRFFAALTATALAQVMFYPVTVVRTQLQVVAPSTKVSKGSEVLRILRHDLKTNGIISLYRGMSPSILRVGLDMTCFELFKILHVNYIHPKIFPNESLPTIPVLGVIGTVATTSASFISYPLLLLRTRMQVAGMTSQIEAPSMLRMAKSVMQEAGFRGFFRGYGIHLAKTVPATASSMTCYELLKRNLGIKTVY